MPTDKDRKRLTRARMQKTGESYTAARAQLIRRKSGAAASPPREAPIDHAAIAGMSNETVKAKTGRTWPEWTRVLDAVDAAAWPHRRIAEYVNTGHAVPQWWAQTVTVGYERIRGLRQTGQRRDGSHEASKSRTIAVPIDVLYRAWSDTRKRKRWLADVAFTVRKATPEKSVRLGWPDGSNAEIYFLAKSEAKSQIAVQHRGLTSKSDADAMKAFWTERLDALAALLS